MGTAEQRIDDALAGALRATRHGWSMPGVVRSRSAGALAGGGADGPGILVAEPDVSPVAIETGIVPAAALAAKARARLGACLTENGRRILAAVAVRIPAAMPRLDGDALAAAIESAAGFDFALFTGAGAQGAARWPSRGWIAGGVRELSLLVQAAAVPPAIIARAADRLIAGVGEAADQLAGIAATHPAALDRIARALRQQDGEQTRRMAAALLASVFLFHDGLAPVPGATKGAHRPAGGAVPEAWRAILAAEQRPIFEVARTIMAAIPADLAPALSTILARTAAALAETGLTRSHDLIGAVLQTLIADRKFLAAYYTMPAAAALMVGLALDRDATPAGASWAAADSVAALKIGDFACGTGTLLSTTYSRLGQYFELEGGNSQMLHPAMMGSALVGADVLPAAAHLTAAMLAGAHPRVRCDDSLIMTMAYGPQERIGPALGSLELLAGEERVPHESFDLIVMNPPFTRPTGHEAGKVGVPNPMFAAFSAAPDAQRGMKRAFDRLLGALAGAHCYDGQAGAASAFIELAHRKLKPGGRLGLITPLSLMSGAAWRAARAKLAAHYDGIILVSVAAKRHTAMAFSADTGMAEAMTVATKRASERGGDARATFVVLDDRPATPLDGYAIADAIRAAAAQGAIRRIEDAPLGGTQIRIGDDVAGHAIDAPLPRNRLWAVCRIADLGLAQAAWRLAERGEVWLPGMAAACGSALPLRRIGDMAARIGPYHADINWNGAGGAVRGPFGLAPAQAAAAAGYPILWTHDADRERAICFEADKEGIVRPGRDEAEEARIRAKVAAVAASASHLHFNQNFQFNSQATAMQYSARRTIGGRAWLSLRFAAPAMEAAVALWGNTSLGLLLHWWQANKQQAGRGNIGKKGLANFVALDPQRLSADQLARSAVLLAEAGGDAMRPFNQIHADPVRARLDRRFLVDILRLPEALAAEGGALALLRAKLAREPSIAGSKRRASP